MKELPVVALEVVVSESPKTIKGSIGTLEAVSPSLGVLLLHEGEMRRTRILRGLETQPIERHLGELHEAVAGWLLRSHQRIEVWSFAQLQRRYELVTGCRHVNPALTALMSRRRAQ